MFAYNPISSRRRPSPDQLRARHFAYREYRSLDWNRHSTMIVLAALLLGGCAKVLNLPLAGIVATLAVAIGFIQDRPAADAPLWLGRLSLATVALFYAGLGFCLGWAAPLIAGGFAAVHRWTFR
jgi:hypothetical protein